MRARSVGFAIAASVVGITISAATLNNTDSEVGKEDASSEESAGVLSLLGIRETPSGDEVVWRVPPQAPLLRPPTPLLAPAVPRGGLRAHAYQYVSRVFDRPSKRPHAVGFVRRNIVLTAGKRASGPGCKGGSWYTLAGSRGYVCSQDGFAVTREPRPEGPRQPTPDVANALPYRYGKASSHDVLRYYDLPTASEEAESQAALAAESRLPEVVARRLDGIYLLALDREERDGERRFYRTVRGRYVRADAIEPKPNPAMRGELLSANNRLPIAFIYGQDPAPLLRRGRQARAPKAIGQAEPHARFHVADEQRWQGTPMVIGQEGIAAPRDRVRIARRIARPQGVPPGEKWIHVDLDEQALIAYEGDQPVFATLVSSGKGAEHATPKGLFQIREKHITTTMSGPDPDEGYYEVEEVPWTMYYQDSYALHGAYWHDEFGNTRSHGCTNLSPVDARWLFYWTDDPVPAGWHALRKLRGTHVYFTRELAPQ